MTNTPTEPKSERELLEEIAARLRDAAAADRRYPKAGWNDGVAAPSAAEYRAKSLFWTRAIGIVVVAWAVLSLAAAVWLGTQLAQESAAVEDAMAGVDNPAYNECLTDADTTFEECQELLD